MISLTQVNNRLAKRNLSGGPVSTVWKKSEASNQTLCSERLQVKMYGLSGTLCDSLGHTTDSTLGFSCLFVWFLAGKLQGQKVEGRGQGDEWDRSA